MSDCLTSEAVESVAKLASDALSAADRVSLIQIPGVKRASHYVSSDGIVETVPHDPSDRDHKLHDVADLPSFLEYAKTTLDAAPVVWINEDGITVVLNDKPESLRLDRINHVFKTTPIYTLLQKMFAERNSESWMDQSTFTRLIRNTIWDYIDEPQSLLRKVRSLKSQQTSQIGRGSGTFSTEVTANDAGIPVELPDEIRFHVNAIDEECVITRREVRCVLEIESARMFRLVPMERDLTEARRADVAEIVGRVRDQVEADPINAPVFCGKPE